MLRLSTPGFSRLTQSENFLVTYAGAEANVSVSVRQFGIPSVHVTRFPDNDLGRAAVQSLRKWGVDTRFIVYGDDRMGLYFLENGAMQRASRIVYDRFGSAFANIKKGDVDWNEILQDASWFHYTGITPAVSQGAADVCYSGLQAARKLGLTISGDINYRRNLWQYGKSVRDVMPSFMELTDIVLAGRNDIENCCGITGDNFEEVCEKTKKRFPGISKIVSTKRLSVSSSHNTISAKAWNGHELLRSKSYELTHIVDRIGAGDAFMAGFIYSMITGNTDQEALEFGTAASAWKHSVEGDFNLASAEEIAALVSGENIGKLLR